MKKNKKIIMGVIAIIVVALIGIGSFIYLNGKKDNSPSWMDLYYDFIKKPSIDSFNIRVKYSDNSKVQFIPRENGYPFMAIEEPTNDKTFKKEYIFLYINEDNEVKYFSFASASENNYVKLIYNREEKKYKWYAVTMESNGEYIYADLEKNIKLYEWIDEIGNYYKAQENEDFVNFEKECQLHFKKEDLVPSENIDTVNPFEEKLISLDKDIKIDSVKIKNLKEIKDSKKEINKAINNIVVIENLVTENTKNYINEENKKLEEKETVIKQKAEEEAKQKAEEEAKKKAEEDAKRKAEEEAKRKAEEDAKKAKTSFKVGSYTINYGTYKGSGGYQGSMEGAILVLKSNGTYTLTNNGRTSNGTFKSNGGYIDFDGGSWSYQALGNNVIGNPASYNEKFTFTNN